MPMSERPRFHLAFPVRDLGEARASAGVLRAARGGRSAEAWFRSDFSAPHTAPHPAPPEAAAAPNPVDGGAVPVPHFGVILKMNDWRALAERLKAAGTRFLIEP